MLQGLINQIQSKSFLVGIVVLSFMFLYLIFGIPADHLTRNVDQGRNIMLEFFASYLGFGICFILLARYFLLHSKALLYLSMAFFSACLSDIFRSFSLATIEKSAETFVFFGTLSYGVGKVIFVVLLYLSALNIEQYTPIKQVKSESLRVFFATLIATLALSVLTLFLIPRVYTQEIFIRLDMFAVLFLTCIFIIVPTLAGYRYFQNYLKKKNTISLWFTLAIFLSILNDIYFFPSGKSSAFALNFGILFRVLSTTTFAIGVIDDYIRYLVQEKEIASNLEKLIVKRTEELERKNRELEDKSKESLEASRLKSELLANMSHELRTPMNAIIGFTNRVIKKSGDALDERQFKNLKTVEKNAHHLLGLINSILDVSKVEAGKMEVLIESFQVEELVKEVVDLSTPLIGNKDLKLFYECPEDVYINSDRTKIKQMLINLVSNSLKFTEEGGIKITVKRTSMNPFLKIVQKKPENIFGRARAPEAQKENHCVQIAVSDTGIGMKKENLKFIFDEFRQVDGSLTRETGGTGLGLSIVKKFSSLLGGGVEVDSEYKKGTCFTITLPINSSFAQRSGKDPHEGADVENRGSVLFVSNNKRIIGLFASYLRDANFIFEAAGSREDAIHRAREIRPSLIIFDALMEQSPIFEILMDLKLDTYLKETPFLLTGFSSDSKTGLLLEIKNSIVKPIGRANVMGAIYRALVHSPVKKILLVDEDVDSQNIFTETLKDEGYEIAVSADVNRAISRWDTIQPDLAFISLLGPTSTGLSFLRVREKDLRLSEKPFVIVAPAEVDDEGRKTFHDKIKELVSNEESQTERILQKIIDIAEK